MKRLILIGGGGHCKSCIDVIESTQQYKIIGVIDKPDKINQTILGYPIIGTDADILTLANTTDLFLITIGHIHSSNTRHKLFQYLVSHQLKLATIISPYAQVSQYAFIKQGTIIMHHALVNSNAIIGKNSIINTKSLIEHDAKIGNHCHISTGTIVNGGATIEDHSFIGSHSTVNLNVTISQHITVASNSLVSKSIMAPGIYKGVPVEKQ